MFNNDFFPTPPEVIEQMLDGFTPSGKVILEPSAGKGNIVDVLKARGAEVIACEKNADLAAIVKTKCRLIASDFLTVTSDQVSHVHAIVMNPPFSADEKHILHAFAIAPPGCEIISLCNYETHDNAYTGTRRRFKQLVSDYGYIENIGSCFDQAERKTDVEVGLVRLKKPATQDNEFDGFFTEEEPEEAGSVGIMPYNLVRDLVNRYISAVKLFDKQMELGIEMHNLTDSFYKSDLSFTCTQEGAPVLRNDFKKDLQKSAWKWVFSKMNMEKVTTKGLKDDLNRFVEQQTQIPFTMKNIYKMLEVVVGTTASRMDRAIIEVFDRLTMHYHENRYNVEGWKTNSHYLMGKKFIMPYMTEVMYDGKMSLSWSGGRQEEIEDLAKALCYITGQNYDLQTTLHYFMSGSGLDFGTWYEWGFFRIKGFKKGTMHFEFKDESVWALLNQHVARIKGYPLPENVRRKAA